MACASVHRRELILGGPTNGTNPVSGQIFKRGVGGYVGLGVAFGRVINIAAYLTLIFFHKFLLRKSGWPGSPNLEEMK
jgi:hypothetical protein